MNFQHSDAWRTAQWYSVLPVSSLTSPFIPSFSLKSMWVYLVFTWLSLLISILDHLLFFVVKKGRIRNRCNGIGSFKQSTIVFSIVLFGCSALFSSYLSWY